MRKRILFRKTICSLLALLLAFSSLMVLPVLAEGEEDASNSDVSSGSAEVSDSGADSGSDSEGNSSAAPETSSEGDGSDSNSVTDTGTSSDDDSGTEDTASSGEVSDSAAGTEPVEDTDKTDSGDKAAGEVENDDKTGTENETEKNTEPADEENAEGKTDGTAKSEGSTEPADETEAKEDGKSDLGENEDPDEKDVEEDEQASLQPAEEKAGLFSERFSTKGPVSGDGDAIYLLLSGTGEGSHEIKFNDEQTFSLEAYQWSGVNLKYAYNVVDDPGVVVEEIEPLPNYAVSVTLNADYLRSCGICLSSASTLTVDGERYSLSDLGFQNSPLEGVSKVDWSLFAKMDGAGTISEWAAARDEGGYYFYVVTNGDADLKVDYSASGAAINDGAKTSIKFNGYSSDVQNGYNGEITGSSLIKQKVGSANYYEAYIPNTFFAANPFAVSGGQSVGNVNIPGVDGKPYVVVPKVRPPYEGIEIDGTFDDWESVPDQNRTEFINPAQNGGGETLVESAIVWDGDYVYVYFKVYAGQPNALGYTGTHGNGKYSIVTDLGRSVYVQPMITNDSISVFGVDGAKIAIDNFEYEPGVHCIEMAIPSSELPRYENSISFRFHLGGTLFENVTNLHPVSQPEIGPVNFACDGNYAEWTDYKHELIEYTTSGSQGKVIDGELALYSSKGKLYGHCYTEYPQHQNAHNQGNGITIRLNDISEKDYLSYPRFIQVGPDGVLDWSPDLWNAVGTNRYLVVDTCVWSSAKTLDELKAQLAESQKGKHSLQMYLYGDAYITVDQERGIAESEFIYDISELARKADIDPESINTISANYIEIGDEWVTIAGTPTGPILGLALCFATVGGVYAKDRKKKKK